MPDFGADKQTRSPVTQTPDVVAPVVVPGRRRLADLLSICFVLIAVGLAGWALHGNRPNVVDALGQLGWWRPVLALAFVTAGLLATAEVWRQCLAALGSPVSSGVARRIFFPAQVGKYLPGSVWPFVAQIRLAREFAVPAGRAVLAGTVFLVVHIVTSVLVGALLLLSQPGLAGRLGWAGACLPVALVLLHPKLVNFLSRRLAGRTGTAPPVLRASALVRPVLWMAPAWSAYGAAGFLLADAFTGPAVELAVVCTAAFALGWLVGLVVFVAPAGVGAREGILVLALAPVIGLAAATTVSVLLRVVHSLADVLLALRYGVLLARRNTTSTADILSRPGATD